MRHLSYVGIRREDVSHFLSLPRYPIEVLEAVVGVIHEKVFTVIAWKQLSVNAPVSWLKPGTQEMQSFLNQVCEEDPLFKAIRLVSTVQIPATRGTPDFEQIAPYSREVNLDRGALPFLERWKAHLAEYAREAGEVEDPFSIAFLHNHPVLRSEYLDIDTRAELETAYDVLKPEVPFSDWLSGLSRDQGLSRPDKEFLRSHSTDGLGLLVHGALDHEDRLKTRAHLVTAYQVRGKQASELEVRMFDTASERNHGDFTDTRSRVIEAAHQASEETGFQSGLVPG